MIPKQAIEKAITGGWQPLSEWGSSWVDIPQERIALDPTFWQALGKALGWDEDNTTDMIWTCALCNQECGGHSKWLHYSHRFYDLILTSGDTEKFWEELLNNPQLRS